MKKILLTIFFLFSASLYSQTGFRIKLLANVNPHPEFDDFTYSALWGYTAPDNREYAILGCFFGTSFIDITDSNNIKEVDYLLLPGGVNGSLYREMKTYSHYCYIVSEATGSKVQIVDLQYLPDSVRYVGVSDIPNHSTTHTISQSGPYLYLNGGNSQFSSGVAVLDLSVNPEHPVLRGRWSELYVHDSRIINDTIWACNINDGKVTVINAVNKDSLKTIRSWTNSPSPNAPHNIALTDNRQYALVTDEVFDEINPGKLKVWDVSDLENITYVTTFLPYQFEHSVVHNIEMYQNYAFLAYYTAGVKVLNISNPASPVEIGWYDTYPENNSLGSGCWGVFYFPTGKIIASDMKRGLFVLRPNLTAQVAGIPKADFTVAQPEVHRWVEEQSFIDMTEGIPTSWQWTIYGPEVQTSTLQNPHLTFNSIGEYNVKLIVSNSFGTDSIIKLNHFRVLYAPLINFQTTNPTGPFRVLTSPYDTAKVIFNWRKSNSSPDIFYKIYFQKILGSTEQYILSGNNGRDTSYLISKGYLDSMAVRFGLTGDSVRVFYKVRAYNGVDSLTSVNSVTMTLRRSTTGINISNEFIPVDYKLYNNFPNPFNPSTNINFDLPKSGIVSLVLFDISGREIMKLINETLAAGSYKYTLNAVNLNSGVYFVRFRTETFSSAIRIVLIK